MWIPAMAIPPSPTAAAQRLTDPERTSPAAKIPGRLVSSGAGRRLFSRHAGASATSAPVLMNPFSSLSISGFCVFQLDLLEPLVPEHFSDLGSIKNFDVVLRLHANREVVGHFFGDV